MLGKISRLILFLANIVCALLLGASLFAGRISPEDFGFPASLILFFSYLLGLNLLFCVFWCFLRRRYAFLSFFVLLLAIPSVIRVYPIFNKNNQEVDGKKITVLSYNTMANFAYKKHHEGDENDGISYILDTDADIVCLQEFNVSKDQKFLTYEDIQKIYAKYPYKHISYKLETKRFKQVGTATFSKYPILLRRRIDIPSRYNSAIYTDVDVEGTILRIVNVHLESNKITGMDKALGAKLKKGIDREYLADITNSFSRKLDEAAKIRAKQVDIVSKLIGQSPHKVVVCGDFNDVPLSYAYEKMRGELTDTFVEAGRGLGLTYCRWLYRLRIDYILCDKDIVASEFKIDQVNYSDHYPLRCSLAMASKKEK